MQVLGEETEALTVVTGAEPRPASWRSGAPPPLHSVAGDESGPASPLKSISLNSTCGDCLQRKRHPFPVSFGPFGQCVAWVTPGTPPETPLLDLLKQRCPPGLRSGVISPGLWPSPSERLCQAGRQRLLMHLMKTNKCAHRRGFKCG